MNNMPWSTKWPIKFNHANLDKENNLKDVIKNNETSVC